MNPIEFINENVFGPVNDWIYAHPQLFAILAIGAILLFIQFFVKDWTEANFRAECKRLEQGHAELAKALEALEGRTTELEQSPGFDEDDEDHDDEDDDFSHVVMPIPFRPQAHSDG